MKPLKMTPAYRYGSMTPWGGSALRDVFHKEIPDDVTGESLEVSVLPGLESRAEDGRTLTEILREGGAAVRGTQVGEEFPLLLKFISARERLSVQVHPDDSYAREHEGGKLGKTEAWVILDCEPGAQLVYGIREGVTREALRAACEQGGQAVEDCLRFVDVKPGDVFYIPAGTVHAIGGGILILEIQQSSDVTYRFWDWGRVGKNGQPRSLHTRQAVDVTKPELHLSKIFGTTSLCKGGSRTYYISNRYFELCRLNVSGKMPVCDGRMLFLTPLGPCTLRWGDEALELAPFDSVLVPAAMEGLTVESDDCKVLMSSLSDREALRKELGYRVENVAGLTEE